MTPTLTQLEQLPCFYRVTIGLEHLDVMGHMNVRHYLAIFDEAAWHFFATFGLDEAYHTSGEGGGFSLQQSVRYLVECRVGDVVTVRARMLGRSLKRSHFMMFMINESRGLLAATLETLVSHADLKIRRTSHYPAHIAAQIDAILADHQLLAWKAPVCGVIRP
jgi:acyl-CoA thioester hydrolase